MERRSFRAFRKSLLTMPIESLDMAAPAQSLDSHDSFNGWQLTSRGGSEGRGPGWNETQKHREHRGVDRDSILLW